MAEEVGQQGDSDALLLEFLASLMDYTPTNQPVQEVICELSTPRSPVNLDKFRLRGLSYDHNLRFLLLVFLGHILNIVFQIPDELAEHYLSRSGFQCPDIRVTRLVSVAAQKFISEIASDALQFCKIRQANAKMGDKSRGQGKDKRLILTTEDLSAALKEYGVNLKKQEYFADSPAAGFGISCWSSSQERCILYMRGLDVDVPESELYLIS